MQVPAYACSDLASWQDPTIALRLKEGKVLSVTRMQDFLRSQGKKTDFEGKVFLIELDNGLKGVFKSLPADDLGDAYAEVGAYQASLVLGFPHIPPTVLRTIQEEHGSLQLFVDTSLDELATGVYAQTLKEIDPEELAHLKIFYFVFGQWDSGPHNLLIVKDQDRKRHVVAIDNSGIRNHQYVQYGSLPFVRTCYSDALRTNDWDQPFPFEKAQTITSPTPEQLKKVFGTKLPESFYQSFKAYNEPLQYVIYQNSLWRQFHAFDKNFVKSHATHGSKNTKAALQKLDLPTLQQIFSHTPRADFLTPNYLKAILERRDQVLKQVKWS